MIDSPSSSSNEELSDTKVVKMRSNNRRQNSSKTRVPDAAEYAELVGCDEENYDTLLASKAEKAETYLKQAMGIDVLKEEEDDDETLPGFKVFGSAPRHFRQRANFRVMMDENELQYVMYSKNSTSADALRIKEFPRGDARINKLMPLVKAECENVNILKRKLIEIRFHSTLRGGIMVLLCYTSPIGAQWMQAAESLVETLRAKTEDPTVLVVGRSKKIQLIAGGADVAKVTETLSVRLPENDEKKDFIYGQLEGEFSQPNAQVCEKMLGWALKATQNNKDTDLLELYCGNGNFGVCLARNFRKVLATEMSKPNAALARANVVLNDLENVKIARVNAAEAAEALAPNARSFNRLVDQQIHLPDYDLKTILVDPPRAGLEDAALSLAQTFDAIVYVSCNPESLARDLATLRTTHYVEDCALFDQFPYTDHTECGLKLVKRKNGPKLDFNLVSSVAFANNNNDTKPSSKRQLKKQIKKQDRGATARTTTKNLSRKRKVNTDDATTPAVPYEGHRQVQEEQNKKRRRLFAACAIM